MINIPKLKNDFNTIIRQRNELQDKRTTLEEKLSDIREHYNDLVKNNSKKIYLYCLDSLYFQYKILRVELEQFQKMISLIFNRMYGDYYKLYNIISSQCKDNCVDIKLPTDNIVIYKDLDPLTEYSLDDVTVTHNAIINMLQQLNELYDSKQSEIGRHNSNMRVGFSVTSFISTLSYENKLLGEHITLYSDYLSFYHSSQRKYFDMALYKINNFMREIEDEILTNHKKDAPVEEIIMEIESEPEPEPPKVELPKATEPEPPKVEPPKVEPPKATEPEPPSVVEPEQSNAIEREQPEDEIKREEVLNDDDFQVVGKGGKRGKKK
uniref:Uncharacterized protein n=1 Tax=viral metagenome TaxID=1070528 RepID=A0A6C0F2F4_9ZZZZ